MESHRKKGKTVYSLDEKCNKYIQKFCDRLEDLIRNLEIKF